MNRILITGATVNIRKEVVNFLNKLNFESEKVFLLRPRHIAEVFLYFKPLLESAKKSGIKSSFAFVITLLHFLPRLKKEPENDNQLF